MPINTIKPRFDIHQTHACPAQYLITVVPTIDFIRVQLAKKLGVSQQHISKIENSEFSSMETLEKVLIGIGYSVRIQVVPLSNKAKNRLQEAVLKSLL